MDEYRIQEAVDAWREELATKPEEGTAVELMGMLTTEERDEAFSRLGHPKPDRTLPLLPWKLHWTQAEVRN